MLRFFTILCLLWLPACSMPRVIVLNDPLDAAQHNDLGVAYEQRGEFDLALREYRAAAEAAPDWAQPWINFGNVRGRQDAWDRAVKAYRRALTREPGNAVAMNNLAWALLEQGEAAAGMDMAERATAAAPDDPRCWDTLAAAYRAVGRRSAARTAAGRGLELAPAPPLRAALERQLRETRDGP